MPRLFHGNLLLAIPCFSTLHEIRSINNLTIYIFSILQGIINVQYNVWFSTKLSNKFSQLICNAAVSQTEMIYVHKTTNFSMCFSKRRYMIIQDHCHGRIQIPRLFPAKYVEMRLFPTAEYVLYYSRIYVVLYFSDFIITCNGKTKS